MPIISFIQRQTLSQFIETWSCGDEDQGNLGHVIKAIANGAIQVSQQVQAASLADTLGETGTTNVHGEIVQKLDAAGSEIFIEALIKSGYVDAVGSEEVEEPVLGGNSSNKGYIVQMDPIDGSSNIDVAISIGSIFGIWKNRDDSPIINTTLLLSGSKQTAAAYVIYGSSTVLVLATLGDVNCFTLDIETSTFMLTHEKIRIPDKCRYYSINEGNFNRFEENIQKTVLRLRADYSLRYVGSLVADFHRNLLKGGVFVYPGDKKNPDGKLRLMYEANPLGFIAEQAGGAASNGEERILEIQPRELHQRVPLIIGNKKEVDETVLLTKGYSTA